MKMYIHVSLFRFCHSMVFACHMIKEQCMPTVQCEMLLIEVAYVYILVATVAL